jgi:hypothetical protein
MDSVDFLRFAEPSTSTSVAVGTEGSGKVNQTVALREILPLVRVQLRGWYGSY